MLTDVFLYANGDSFVKGNELGDFLLPNYPGGRDFLAQHPTDTWNWFTELHLKGTPAWNTRNDIMDLIEKEEQQRNFTAKLAQKLNVDFYNAGTGGAGMDRIARTTIADLIELKKTKKNIVAVIGTAEPLRMELPGVEVDAPWIVFHPGNPVDGTSSFGSPFSEITNYYYMNVSNYHRIVIFLKNIVLIKDFCCANRIKLLWISGNSLVLKDYTIEEHYANNKDIIQLLDYTKFTPAVDMQQIARSINHNVVLPGYHFAEIVHEETARQLVELI